MRLQTRAENGAVPAIGIRGGVFSPPPSAGVVGVLIIADISGASEDRWQARNESTEGGGVASQPTGQVGYTGPDSLSLNYRSPRSAGRTERLKTPDW